MRKDVKEEQVGVQIDNFNNISLNLCLCIRTCGGVKSVGTEIVDEN